MEDQKFVSPQGQHSLKKFLKGFTYAFKGIQYAFKTQINFKFHTTAGVFTILAGYYFNLNTAEWLWIMAAVSLVLISELFNTALELLVDLVSPGYNKKAGAVKDLASGAVLVTAVFALAVGVIIFLPKLGVNLSP
ncbi:diacylglycerol kinase family protein [Desertivirga arenae]|uniref:diacylglycerol kinase family protein n=1 Tax=Desertivirga arenae TaxID=2810309 RepID=UPI001F616F55|nr:diacylglycerol kinase family protein [Pedobacter sp. SYSU D00823]